MKNTIPIIECAESGPWNKVQRIIACEKGDTWTRGQYTLRLVRIKHTKERDLALMELLGSKQKMWVFSEELARWSFQEIDGMIAACKT